jgi:hypothetical protein
MRCEWMFDIFVVLRGMKFFRRSITTCRFVWNCVTAVTVVYKMTPFLALLKYISFRHKSWMKFLISATMFLMRQKATQGLDHLQVCRLFAGMRYLHIYIHTTEMFHFFQRSLFSVFPSFWYLLFSEILVITPVSHI